MPKQRLIWLDLAKGLGINLVVIGHAGRGLMSAGTPDEGGILEFLDLIIYSFHMPLFFIISGITTGMRPISSIRPDLLRRIWRIFYPLIFWTYIFLAMRAVAGVHANTPVSWMALITLPLPPVAHFWFLWALLLNVSSFAIASLCFRPLVSDVRFWAIAVLVSAVLNGVVTLPSSLVPWFGAATNYSLAFALGGLIGASQIRQLVPSRGTAIIAIFLFSLGLWQAVKLNTPALGVLVGCLLSLLLLVHLTWVADRFSQWRLFRAIAFFGSISLAIYVMHTIFSAFVRIGLFAFGVYDLAVNLVFGVVAGVLGPLLVYVAARRLGVLRVVGLA
jgi:fucose 4-O-acetylase-like acetyltransferase